MSSHVVDRIKDYLEQLIESYNKIKQIELNGSTKEELRKELIQIRDSCEELPALFAQTAKEANLDFDKIKSITDLFKIDFLNGIRAQIMVLTQSNSSDNVEAMKVQASMTVALMGNYIGTCKFIYTLLK